MNRLETPKDNDIHVLALVKGEERYIILFTVDKVEDTLRQLGRMATDEDLSFSWYDAAIMSQKLRNKMK